MPKAPVLNREALFMESRDGRLRQLDWNLVNTSVGAMVEPRQVSLVAIGSNLNQLDYRDSQDFNKLTVIDENKLASVVRTQGTQLPVDYNNRA